MQYMGMAHRHLYGGESIVKVPNINCNLTTDTTRDSTWRKNCNMFFTPFRMAGLSSFISPSSVCVQGSNGSRFQRQNFGKESQ